MRIDASTVFVEFEERSTEPGEPASLFVNVKALPALGLDRAEVYGWSTGLAAKKQSRALAERLRAAVLAGAALGQAEPAKDINGRTYLAPTGCARVMGRRMNADLKGLGF